MAKLTYNIQLVGESVLQPQKQYRCKQGGNVKYWFNIEVATA